MAIPAKEHDLLIDSSIAHHDRAIAIPSAAGLGVEVDEEPLHR